MTGIASQAKYLVACTIQRAIPGGAKTCYRIGWFGGLSVELTVDNAVQWLREFCGLLDSEYRVIAKLVCKNQPFDNPTRCVVGITTMPTYGPLLRLTSREFTISDEFTLVDAFTELCHDEPDAVIGYSWMPAEP